MATALIIVRIVVVVKQAEGEARRYALTIEVLVESGGLYAAALMITGILYLVKGEKLLVREIQLYEAEIFWQQGILPPITVFAAAFFKGIDH